jgi:putative spermidine/putrescine transport system ATP-binding protein
LLSLRGIAKSFGETAAIADVDLDVAAGEFLILLGPSGCGKTTLLRIIAGLLEPDRGRVRLDGEEVQDLPAHSRRTAMVFQSYALFPHMTVERNIAFGLVMRGLDRVEIRRRVAETLALVELQGLAGRYPRELSGGQQQRVALARALVTEPRVLLLDEPLSNLDAKLRDRLRIELRALQRRLALTTVFVTHDQAEAMALSDRIAVMSKGRLVELGTPEEIYSRPQSRFAAEFVGIANLLPGTLSGEGRQHFVDTALGRFAVLPDAGQPGPRASICLRPEDIAFGPADDGLGLIGQLTHVTFAGPFQDCIVRMEQSGLSLRAHVPVRPWHIGERVAVRLPERAAVLAASADPH